MHINRSWLVFIMLLLRVVVSPDQASADQNASIAPPAGAEAYWSFDAGDIAEYKAVDKSGNGNDGLIHRADLRDGRLGQALYLVRGGDGITIENLRLKGKQQSVSLWIKRQGDGLHRLIYINGLHQVGFTGEQLFVHTGRVGRADTSTPMVSLDIPKNEWTHLVVTWDTAAPADHVKVYVNGALRATGTLDQARDKHLYIDTLRLGHMEADDTGDQTFHGAIDEVAVYNRTLPADQIAEYYEQLLTLAGGTSSSFLREIVSPPAEPLPLYFPDPPYTGRKKLLRVGSELVGRMLDSESIADADLPTKVRLWQDRGLDGLVFSIASHDRSDPDKYWNMSGQWWALIPRTYEEFIPDVEAFRSVEDWGRLTDNFLFCAYAVWKDGPKTECQDWFSDEDWEIILNNSRIQARIVRECGFKGILFDTEQYEGHHALGTWHIPFNYQNYREDGYIKEGRAEPRSFDEVAAQLRKRGEQYTRALCEEYPGLKILVIPGLYEWAAREEGDGPLENRHHGLYPAFLDGMLAGLDDQATIICGNELTYTKTRYNDIGNERRRFDESIEKLCNADDELKKRMSFAAGIWVDTNRTWSDTDVTKNVRNPADHERAVRNAFWASDEYAWVYGEQSRYLEESPTPLMIEYFKASDDAHDLKEPPKGE